MTKPPAESYLRRWLCHFGYIILIFSQGSPALLGCDIDTTCIFYCLNAKYSAPILFVILI